MSDYLSVTSLTKYLKMKFDRDPYLERVYLTGQVSNFRRRPSHQYFSLKDEGAVIQATMWAGVFKKLGFSRFGSFFASKDAKGMSQTMYETFKNVVDEDFSEIFSSVKSQTLIFWGQTDSATPLKSGEKIHSLITNSEFYALNGEHFFFLDNAPLIAKSVLNALSKAKDE